MLQHAVLRGDRLFCYERPAGAEQFVLTRRSAVDPTDRAGRPARPGDVERRRGDGDRLVLPVRATVRWSPSASARAGRNTPCCTSSSGARRLAGRRRRRSDPRHPGVARSPGNRTEPASSTSAIRPATTTTARSTTIASAPTGAPTLWCGTTGRTRRPGQTCMLTPDGRWLIVHVEVGYRRTDVHVLDRQTDRWTTLIGGVDATTHFSVDCRRTFARRHHEPRRPTRPGRAGRPRRRRRSPGDPTRGRRIVAEGDDVIAQLAVTRQRAADGHQRRRRRHRPPPRRRRNVRCDVVDGLGDVDLGRRRWPGGRSGRRRRLRRRRHVRRPDGAVEGPGRRAGDARRDDRPTPSS